MNELIKNIEKAKALPLKEMVHYESGKVVSLSLAQHSGAAMTLFAFDADEGISTHAAPGDAMAVILEGRAKITINGNENLLSEGDAIVMPVGIPHAVKAVSRFKMLLTVIK